MSLPDVFTIEEAAKWLKVSKEIVQREIETGRLKAFKIADEWRIPDTFLTALFDTTPRVESLPPTRITLNVGSNFDYEWPLSSEHFVNVKEGELKEGKEIISVKIGECVRKAFGRDRRRILVFFDGYPNAEFVETDEPTNNFCTFLPGNPNPREHLWQGDTIDHEWLSFNIKKQSEVIRGPRVSDGFVIVVPQNDFETMVRFTRIKAHKRYGW